MDDPSQESAAQEALRRLEARLEQASNAAERLMAEAAQTVAGRVSDRRVPPAGWQAMTPDPEAPDAGEPEPARGGEDRDAELLAEVVHRLRDLIPPELQRRLAEALRELLLALRALIDWYLDRMERRRANPRVVTDIPIR